MRWCRVRPVPPQSWRLNTICRITPRLLLCLNFRSRKRTGFAQFFTDRSNPDWQKRRNDKIAGGTDLGPVLTTDSHDFVEELADIRLRARPRRDPSVGEEVRS